MSVRSIKQITVGLAVTLLSVVPLSAPVLAATDQEAAEAAQAGVEYLAANQNPDGSVTGSFGETEWTVVAVAAAGQDPDTFKKEETDTSVVEFLENDPPTESTPATTTQRKVLAIAAAGKDIAQFGSVDYQAALASQHVDDQIGDPTLLNDDIFGVIAIDAAQAPVLKDMAQDGLDYILAHQQTDGGFSYTTLTCDFCGSDSNDTAAAIIAMDSAEQLGLTHALLVSSKEKAVVYLLSTQQADGGFGYDPFSVSDGSSTAWALMALNVIGDSVQTEAQAARDWLLANQNSDGGFSYGAFGLTESSTSVTAHAVLALLGSSWLLRPEPTQVARGGSSDSAAPQGITSSTSTNQPNVVLAAADTSTSSPTQSSQATSNSPVAAAGDSDTKAAKTTDKPATQSDNKDKSNPNYAWVGIPILLAIGGGWYVVQSRNKQGA